MNNTIQKEIKRIRKAFPYGTIKKIYELPHETCIIKFKPNEKLKHFLRSSDPYFFETYRYCIANMYGLSENDMFCNPPMFYASFNQLMKEYAERGGFNPSF